jgi:hypothetical protein
MRAKINRPLVSSDGLIGLAPGGRILIGTLRVGAGEWKRTLDDPQPTWAINFCWGAQHHIPPGILSIADEVVE